MWYGVAVFDTLLLESVYDLTVECWRVHSDVCVHTMLWHVPPQLVKNVPSQSSLLLHLALAVCCGGYC